MLDVKNDIDGLTLDRSEWKLVSFGDVAIQQKQTVDRENTDLKRYVKGEHMNSEDIHLRNWGELKDEYLGPAFIRKFENGDILYGSRRTYLRKVVVAPFDGITSNTTFVVKANEKLIEPSLLPYIMLSEGFSQHSIKNSKGSVNPYVNWKDLAKFEFLLPPLNDQKKLIALFGSLDSCSEKDLNGQEKLETLLKVIVEKHIHGLSLEGMTVTQAIKRLARFREVKPLRSLGAVFKGKGIPKSEVVDEGLPCVRYGELYTKHHQIIRQFYSHINTSSAENSISMKQSDVLFAGSGETITEIGKSASFIGNEKAYIGSDILVFRPMNMDPFYSGYLMNSSLVRNQLNMFGTGATVMHIYAADIEKILVPVLSDEEQIALSNEAEAVAKSIFQIKEKIRRQKSLLNNLLNQVF